ncbi:MAG: ABC transporter permease [Clostridium sp.]|jgi:peptide/nickel transport system permease protein|nr:ABC transporter permease [Clostridium sp.]
MLKFIAKRLAVSVLILFFVTFLIYALEFSLPTSYVEMTARELATKPGAAKSAKEWIAELNVQYGMDKGLVRGYFTWMGNAVRGNFGDSWNWTMSVTETFRRCIWYSFALSSVAFLLEIFLAVPLGVLAARKQYSLTDYSVTVVSLIGISMPTFFVATVLKMIFSVKLGWFELSGMQGRDFPNLSELGQFLDLVAHMVLPAATLVIVNVGGLMRYTRTNMLEVLNSDYIRTARAKGLPESKVIGRHAFRNTLIPLITLLGSSLPGLFAGALITETLFSIRGIGFTSYYSMINGDIPFTMFYLAFSAILTLLGNLAADILYAVVDPRVRVN